MPQQKLTVLKRSRSPAAAAAAPPPSRPRPSSPRQDGGARGTSAADPAVAAGLRDALQLAAGPLMPVIGFGTYKMKDDVAAKAVASALRCGYRLIDTAQVYGNAQGVAQGIARSGVPRAEIFLQTKQWRTGHGYERTKAQFAQHLKKLQTDYVDALLIHWPGPKTGWPLPKGAISPPDWTPEMRDTGTWRALEELYDQGKARAIGVCNYSCRQLRALLRSCRVRPMVNQVEFHPLLVQSDLLELCQREGIVLQAFASLGGTDGGPSKQQALLGAAPVVAAAGAHGATPGQVLLRWAMQKGCAIIPKSTKEARMLENAECAAFSLTPAEVAAIDALHCGRRLTWKGLDPDSIE
eukprot:TRINITY_DN3941_c0_g1_i1.p1 TRINITY_DN3941_c0_g1~~TRINITY_DN3941_c0_g1_i1.p1  ORF type:complete len:375 (+),score=132.99 TRINITY_DN3941_c0_g1_i1:72-1127(+)